jgi:hypothetical protein
MLESQANPAMKVKDIPKTAWSDLFVFTSDQTCVMGPNTEEVEEVFAFFAMG